jgi:WD40 repeat protein
VCRITELDAEKNESERKVLEMKAHIGDVTDIVIRNELQGTHIITAGRDRMVQVFLWKGESLDLLQTLNDHVGAVTGLLLVNGDKQLLSCSADRNIIVRDYLCKQVEGREISAYIKNRSMVLKATPLSMTVDQRHLTNILVSTADKQVLEYDLSSGVSTSGFKVSDIDGSNTAILSNITQLGSGSEQSYIAGVSNTDKSVRMYDMTGNLVARDYGHTEGIAGICTVSGGSSNEGYSVVTIASDGTIFLWKPAIGIQDVPDSDPVKGETPLVIQAPVRRVLNPNDLAQLQDLRAPSERRESTTGSRPGSPKRNPSKLSQVQTPIRSVEGRTATPRRMSAAPPPPLALATFEANAVRRDSVSRSASPVGSPRMPMKAHLVSAADRRRKSLSTGTPTNDINVSLMAVEQMCRSLQFFRKKLAANTTDTLPAESIRDLQRELDLTIQCFASKNGDQARNEQAAGGSLPAVLGDEERLMRLLETRIEARLLERLGHSPTESDGSVGDTSSQPDTTTTSTTTASAASTGRSHSDY